ncbi:MAG: CvpA family protein [Hyphomonadaceae bacterium]|nr:CvpA family protein [Hyphomonadaceae bacterium]
MEALGLTWFDLIALAIVAFSGVMAFARGLIREVFSIVAFIGASIAAIYGAERVRPFVESVTDLDGALAMLAAGLLIFLAVFIVVTILTSVIAKQAHESTEIGSFDRAAGLAFGLLRGVLVVALFVLLLRQTTDDARVAPQASIPSSIVEARTYPVFESVAVTLEGLLPQARARARDIIERRAGESPQSPQGSTPEAQSN